jgi:hypothetical protein
VTRDPAGRAGSYSNCSPETTGNLPDAPDTSETPFSSISLMMVPLTEANRAWFLNGTTAATIALSMDPLPSPARMPPVLMKAMYSPAA